MIRKQKKKDQNKTLPIPEDPVWAGCGCLVPRGVLDDAGSERLSTTPSRWRAARSISAISTTVSRAERELTLRRIQDTLDEAANTDYHAEMRRLYPDAAPIRLSPDGT